MGNRFDSINRALTSNASTINTTMSTNVTVTGNLIVGNVYTSGNVGIGTASVSIGNALAVYGGNVYVGTSVYVGTNIIAPNVGSQLAIGTSTPSQTGGSSVAHVAGGNFKIDSNRQFAWDGTNPTYILGASGGGGTLTFNAGNSGSPVVLNSSGDVFIQSTTSSTSTTTGALKVSGGAGIAGNLNIGGTNTTISGNVGIGTSTIATGNAFAVYGGNVFFNGSTQLTSLGIGTPASGTTGEIRATNEVTAYYSDERLKAEIANIPDALAKVEKINGVTYTQNKLAEQFGYNDYRQQVGVIAQEIAEVLPEAIRPAPFDIDADGNSKSGENYLTVKYENIVPLLIEAIKELSAKLKKLEGK